MKKAKDYLEEFWGTCEGKKISDYDVELVIKLAQIDAIETTVKRCAEVADFKEFKETPQDRDSIGNDHGDVYAVDKEAILDLADELKKLLT